MPISHPDGPGAWRVGGIHCGALLWPMAHLTREEAALPSGVCVYSRPRPPSWGLLWGQGAYGREQPGRTGAGGGKTSSRVSGESQLAAAREGSLEASRAGWRVIADEVTMEGP